MNIQNDQPPSMIPKKRKILLPLDGSDSSLATLHWGVRYLDKAGTSIYLLNVASSKNDESLSGKVLEQAKALLEKSGFQVAKSNVIQNQDISAAICKYADEEKIGHIIMGSQGKPFGRVIIGSKSRAVMEKARQPVLIIKNPELPGVEFNEPDLSIRTHARSVLIPVDTETTAETLIPLMASLLDKGSAVIHLLHAVVYDPYNASHINAQFESGKKIIEKNRDAFEAAGYWVAEAEARSGDPLEVILKYAQEKSIDQISLLSRHLSNIEKFLFGSVSTGLMKQDQFKVLVFGYGSKKKKQPDKVAL